VTLTPQASNRDEEVSKDDESENNNNETAMRDEYFGANI
jgi:hypothetical protein